MRAILAALLLLSSAAHARDVGQWNDEQEIRQWFATLMQPDNPRMSCCGEADAYWADKTEVDGDKVYAVVTDDREDGPLGRHHVEIGTRILIPPNKIKFDRGNPTGHVIVFLSLNNDVYCYVNGAGI